MKRKLPQVNCKYGAPMGRNNNIPPDIQSVGTLHLERLIWVDHDYDQGGAYWGRVAGQYIYWAYGETIDWQVDIFVRASCRDNAKTEVIKFISKAKFYR